MWLHGACIQTHHIEPMAAFYQSVFGYAPTVDGGVDFRFLKNQLIVFRHTDADMPATKNMALIYAVEDVDAEYAKLNSRGLAHSPPTDKPWGVRSFVISDPDGNTISFFCPLEKGIDKAAPVA